MTIQEIVDDIMAGSGADKIFTREALLQAAEKMEKAGWAYELIAELLGNIFEAIIDEYVPKTDT